MALMTQADLEKFLQIDITSEPEPVVTMLIENAEGLIRSYTHRTVFEQTAITNEVYDSPGWDNPKLFLREYPVMSVQSVTEDGTVLTVDEDYLVWRRSLIRIAGSKKLFRSWEWGFQIIEVDYTAGYAASSPELNALRDVCTRIVARAFQSAAAYAGLPAGAEGIRTLLLAGSDSVTYKDNVSDVASSAMQLTEGDQMALSRFRKRVLA